MTATTEINVSTAKLQRLVGLVLAKAAAAYRRSKRRHGYALHGESELNVHTLREGIIKELNVYEDKWYKYHKFLTAAKLRKALNYWEGLHKVQAKRHGRHGNSYRWVLFAETNQWDRRERKHKAREEKNELKRQEREQRTIAAQATADQLADHVGLPPGSFQAWNETITITLEQAQLLILAFDPESDGRGTLSVRENAENTGE